MKNKLALEFADNPELKAALGGKEPGDRIELTFEVMVVSTDDERFEADIESVTVDGETDESADADADTPVMALIIGKPKTGKTSKSGKKSEDDAEDAEDTES
jgi:hypothetical protein